MSILFMILKMIGFVFLAILGVFLLVICIALFSPIKYRLKAYYELPQIQGEFTFSWIFNLVFLGFYYNDDGFRVKLRLAWKKFFETKAKEEKKDASSTSEPENEIKISNQNNSTNDITHINPSQEDADNEKTDENIKKDDTKKSGLNDKLNGAKSMFDKAKHTYNHEDRQAIIAHTILLIKQLGKKIRPKQFSIKCEVGFESPDITGYVIGVISVINTQMPKLYRLNIKGNFEKQILIANVSAYGRVSLWSLLWPFCKYIFKKPIWKIVKKQFFGKNKERID